MWYFLKAHLHRKLLLNFGFCVWIHGLLKLLFFMNWHIMEVAKVLNRVFFKMFLMLKMSIHLLFTLDIALGNFFVVFWGLGQSCLFQDYALKLVLWHIRCIDWWLFLMLLNDSVLLVTVDYLNSIWTSWSLLKVKILVYTKAFGIFLLMLKAAYTVSVRHFHSVWLLLVWNFLYCHTSLLA